MKWSKNWTTCITPFQSLPVSNMLIKRAKIQKEGVSRHHSLYFLLLLQLLMPCFWPRTALISLHLYDVVTSELDCVDFQAVSLTQPSDFLSALFLTAFLSTYCCIFLLSFSFPVNDTWVSFFIFLHNNYSYLNEKQTEKWTKKR